MKPVKEIKEKNNIQSLQKIICLFEDSFSIDWIMAMTELKPTTVLIELDNAIQEGWIRQADVGQFSICDLKKKKLILSSIEPKEKEQFTRKIAQFFLDEYLQNDLDITKVAGFLLKITNDEKGCRGLLLAGDAFVKSYQPDKALECYTKLKSDLLCLKKNDSVDDLFIDMAIKYSKLSTAQQSTTQVIQTLDDAMDRALKRDDKASQAMIQMHIAKNEWLLNRYDTALKTFKKGWKLANQCKDPKLLRSALSFKTFFSFWQGRYKAVISHYENSITETEKHPQSGFPLLVTITVGQCYTHVGQINQGVGMLDALKRSCLEAGDMKNAAFAVASISTALLMSESPEKTLEYAKKTYVTIQQSENHYIGLLVEGFLAYLYYLKGDLTRSVSFLKKFLQKCQNVNIDILHHRPYVLELCWAMEQGEYPQILDLSLKNEVKKLISGQNVFLKGLAYRYKALLEIQTDASQKAVMRSLSFSLKWLEESGHELEILKTRMEILRRYLMVNDQENVKKVIRQIGNKMSQYHADLIPPDLRALLMEKSSDLEFLKRVFTIGSKVMTISDSRDFIPKILSTVNQLTGAERGAIFVLDKHKVILKASKNLTQEQVMEPGFKSSMKLIEQVIFAGVSQKPTIENNLGPIEDSIRSCICLPIISKGKVTGALYHDNRLLNSVFKKHDFEWLSFFAAQLSMAIDNINAQEQISHLELKLQDEKRYAKEQYYPTGRFKDVIGKSDAIRRMLFLVEQVAGTDTKVLILGETGVGKELVANAIHYQSARKDRPFIKANCSALTETLINSELFGHERGAFSGANQRRIGRFEQADGGTIFLDEIGDLPLNVQVNLLRVLQNKKFERVGGNETIQSNFRLIAATNNDLQQLVREKKFREDLYFRLNVFPIHVPPLRQRKEDIPLLVHHFTQSISKKMNKDIKKIPAKEMHKLVSHSWPGNIRELENAIERAVVLNSTAIFKTADIDMADTQYKTPSRANSLKENERNHILWALEEKNWKVRGPGGVAEFLNIHPSTLTARMKKLGIKRSAKTKVSVRGVQ